MFVDELHFPYDHVELFGFFYVESTGIEAKGIILVFSFYYKLKFIVIRASNGTQPRAWRALL